MTLSIDLDPKTEAQLNAAVARQGLAAPEIIKKLLRDYLPPIQPDVGIGDFGGVTLGDIIAEIGFVEGGPTDMARHPEKYMKGFGETKSRRNLAK